jgi:hypothetical protein
MKRSDNLDAVLSLRPTSWSALPYMSDVQGLSEKDIPCLKEIRDVLAKHQMLERFGINLLHKHFEIKDTEILVETIDFEKRTLMTTPKDRSVIGDCVETSWSLSENDARIACGKTHCWSTCIEQEKSFRDLVKSS